MKNKLIPISLEESFRFSCSAGVACFNECCRDLNQFLTPYDILRLKNYLRISSGDFIKRYCSRHTGPESGLPVIRMRPEGTKQLTCPFVTSAGCSVYECRPSSCRIYPLVRAIARSKETGEISEHFMLLRESHCLGFHEGRTQTVRQWNEEQDMAVYNAFNDRLMEIISLKNRLMTGPLGIESSRLFCLALYDLDNFRSQILNGGLFDGFKADPAALEEAKSDDVVLLKLGLEWVKRMLLNASVGHKY